MQGWGYARVSGLLDIGLGAGLWIEGSACASQVMLSLIQPAGSASRSRGSSTSGRAGSSRSVQPRREIRARVVGATDGVPQEMSEKREGSKRRHENGVHPAHVFGDPAQGRDVERRAVGAEEEHGIAVDERAFGGAGHALAEIASPLRDAEWAWRGLERLQERAVVRRHAQGDRTQGGGVGPGQRVVSSTARQAGRSLGSQSRDEAGSGRAGSLGEDEDAVLRASWFLVGARGQRDRELGSVPHAESPALYRLSSVSGGTARQYAMRSRHMRKTYAGCRGVPSGGRKSRPWK